MSDIVNFFTGKSVLITGATGFMGKVLLAKLLTCMPDINNIYVLLRPKKGLTAKERIEKLLNNKPFTLIQIDRAQMEKVVAVSGDVTEINLGICDEDRATIINEVSIVFHFAAAVKFDLPLKQAFLQNVIGTESILNLCTEIKNLKAVVHLSTAFCNVDIEDTAEVVYDIPGVSPRKIIDMVGYLSDEQLSAIEKTLISPHPNTYTYTKRLAELLIKEAGAKLPLVIVRPSIVVPGYDEPVPGWVDSLNGPIGLTVALFKGVCQMAWMDNDLYTPYVPVDVATDIAIVASFVRCTQKFTEPPVFHATTASDLTMGKSYNYLKEVNKQHPYKRTLWHCNVYHTKHKLVYEIGNIFLHVLPALFIDFLLVVLLQKPFLLNMNKKLNYGMRLFAYFNLRSFIFRTENTDSLRLRMNDHDRAIFNVFEKRLDVKRQLYNAFVYGRTYYLKDEPIEEESFARTLKYYRFYLLDKVLKVWIFYLLFKYMVELYASFWLESLPEFHSIQL